ncbi:glycoside hydrolase family 15 protein [Cohnella cholangitidis]|uniref:Glycoside hydrolase family 15 n=1 Tax=Cohnella cholangitidis TaxID=2598458 RepID=A0A7G5C3X4_9BACL|nr:glycoside hydrolase family 15 protein [Cohnella cholangitidis]QMV43908.1 glycoside hydrolase family 15 [Cohnella cholangitidis]
MIKELKLQQHLRKKPYLVDAIAGNSAMLVSLGQTGRMYRLWWPHIDYPQHVDEIRTGLKLGTMPGGVTWFDDPEAGWQHAANYVPRTNAYRVTSTHSDYPITVEQTDFAVPGQPLFVRGYRLTNRGHEATDVEFYHYGSFRIMDNELYMTTEFVDKQDALLHFRHQYAFAVGSSEECSGYQAGNGAWNGAASGNLNGNQIDMQPDGAMKWNIAAIGPGQSVEIPVYIAAGHSRNDALAALTSAKGKSYGQWYEEMVAYWSDYLANAAPCPGGNEQIVALYERSQLAMKLMADEATGTIVAAPEFDEYFSRCGGYAYSWGRDAAFVTTAFNKAGLGSLSEKFYDWSITAQEPDGSWQQRHYHDGSLAPHWGLQIDEGSSLIWGMWEYYLHSGEREAFLERVWPAVEKGAAFLVQYLDPETGLPKPSKDLWEEREAEHTYSAAAVYGGLTAASSFAKRKGKDQLAEAWNKAARQIAASIEERCWNESKNSYYRGLKLTVSKEAYEAAIARGERGYVQQRDKGYSRYVLEFDPIVDISLLGISVPFNAVAVDNPRMAKTADTIEQLLTSPKVGGIKRYEDDTYIGGNPWILTTLWLSHYRTLQGRYEDARKLLDYAVDHVTSSGLLPEQVDQETGETAWVVPLTWSHAMFVLAVHMLAERGQL